MEFRIGDKVVYPNHGVGIIEEVTSRAVNGGMPEEFYMLRIHSNASLVMVPTTNVKSVGLRKIIKKADVDGLFKLLAGDFFEPEADWKGRYKDHSEKMRTGSIFQVAEVLKNLVYLSYQEEPLLPGKTNAGSRQTAHHQRSRYRARPEREVRRRPDRPGACRSLRTLGQSFAPRPCHPLTLSSVCWSSFCSCRVFFRRPRLPSWPSAGCA